MIKIVADTNVLVRAVVADDLKEAALAQKVLKDADLVAISIITFCEFYWVLSRVYQISDADIQKAILALANASSVITDKLAIEKGLLFMNNGGNFADGILLHLGIMLGGETFVSFDEKLIKIAKSQSINTKLLS